MFEKPRYTHAEIKDYSASIRNNIGGHISGLKKAWVLSNPRMPHLCTHSFRFDFEGHARELRVGLLNHFNIPRAEIPKTRLVVLAGFGGHFSAELQRMGFQVIHTDLMREYAKGPQTFPTLHSPAHEIPHIRNVGAYVSFEAVQIYSGFIGYITILKSLLQTRHGLIDIGVQKAYFRNNLEQVFDIYKQVYGCNSEAVDSGPFRFYGLSLGHADRRILEKDLAIMLALNNSHRTNFSPESIAKELGIKPDDIHDAIHRYQALSMKYNDHLYRTHGAVE
ncbi:MAG: hypothetical protein PHH82_01920 [Candidatus ainarchaeum sp.]|nr:hypothetical protein [Candidatus ainarchaeum sp.]